MKVPAVLSLLLALGAPALRGDDEFTLYELLPPETHRFAITYDVAATREGSRFYANPIRPGSVASDERVVDARTGKELKFEVVKARQVKAEGLVREGADDEALYIKVHLPEAVPKGGETRLRIFKTYTDAKSYATEGDRIVFDRGLSIRRNAVVLPRGYELVGCTVPAIVSLEKDGRVKLSFMNDRDDTLPVKVTGRRLAGALQ